MTEASTPLMRQYQAAKQQVPNALLLFRLGDFYELFFEDAITAARELEITLTARNKERGDAVPALDQTRDVAIGGVIGNAAHGNRLAPLFVARRERNFELARSRDGVVVEQLVEIAQTK